MTGRIVLRPRAQRDIETIWDHTAVTWSIDQAETYVRALQATLQMLARNPGLGRACDEVRAGYRKHPSGSHLIFYRVLRDGIDVVRILHGRMDVGRHLP